VRDGLHSEFANAGDSPGFLLWRVSNTWQAAQRSALQPFGLTHVLFVLLASLTWLKSDGPITHRELADYAHTDPMMTSQVLRALEAKTLILRSSHPTDGRARALAVTRQGAELADAAVEGVDRVFFGQIDDDLPAFTELLRRLTAAQWSVQ